MSKALLHHAVDAATIGGSALLYHYGRLHDVHDKGEAGDLVTEADRHSEELITGYLKSHCPSHSILAEESGAYASKDSSEFLWVIDPLDGTTNYAHGYPFFAVSVALLYQGNPIVGVVYNPITDELFTAMHNGGGAFLNGRHLQVSNNQELAKSLLATGFPYDRRTNPDTNNYAAFCHLTDLSHGVRRDGSASLDLAYVAAGRLEGYWERGIKAWDIAAGSLLVSEAGGTVSDYQGGSLDLFGGCILATNSFLHRQLSDALLTCPIKLS